jgi:hypothetical protein
MGRGLIASNLDKMYFDVSKKPMNGNHILRILSLSHLANQNTRIMGVAGMVDFTYNSISFSLVAFLDTS